MNRNRAVIFSAPQGTDKPLNATTLMQRYGCIAVVDEYSPEQHKNLVPGTLYLTNMEPNELLRHGVAMDKAMIIFRNTGGIQHEHMKRLV